jgi:ribonuclease J
VSTSTLRVLALGGLGEIGKNMTVLEYDGRLVVIDTGLRFPTADMLGIDLVLPDFTYLKERVNAIEAIVITHGHEDHLGALPWVLRELRRESEDSSLPPIYGGPLTIAMARSKLDEHNLRDVRLRDVAPGEEIEAGPFTLELVHMTHSIPDACAVAAHTELGTVLLTGDYKFDQTPVDGGPADIARLAELGSDGVLLLCGDSTNADRPGFSPSERGVGPHLEEVFARAQGRIIVTSFASNIHRVQQVVDAAAALNRKVALVGRSMRKNVNIGRSLGHIEVPEGMLVQPHEIEQFPAHRIVIISTGSQGEPLSALRRMAYDDHRQVSLRDGDTVVFSATPIPGNERAVNETIDRLYHIGCTVITPREAPILRSRVRRGAEADAQPRAAALRDADPRRSQAHPSACRARRGGRDRARSDLRVRERAAVGHHRHGGEVRRAGAGGDGVRRRRGHRQPRRRRAARPADAVRGRHLHRGGDDLRTDRRVGRAGRGDLPRRAVHRPG